MSLGQNDAVIINSEETKRKGNLSHARCIDLVSNYILLRILISFYGINLIEIIFMGNFFYRIKHVCFLLF